MPPQARSARFRDIVVHSMLGEWFGCNWLHESEGCERYLFDPTTHDLLKEHAQSKQSIGAGHTQADVFRELSRALFKKPAADQQVVLAVQEARVGAAARQRDAQHAGRALP